MSRSKFNKYWAIFTAAFKASVYFKNRILAQALIQVFRITILMLVYAFVYSKLDVSGPVTLQIAVWSIAAYFCVLSIRFKNLFYDINQDIKSGNIEVLLSRPVNYVAYRIINQIGGDISSFLLPVCATFVLLPIFIGFPGVTVTIPYLLSVVVIIILGLFVGSLLYTLVGFAAFWLEDATPVYWIIDKGVLLLGGSYLPVAFYPDFMKLLVYYSPFGASMFVSQIFYTDYLGKLPMLITSQLVWIVILLIVVRIVYKKAVKQLTINGG
jgi:ABC-2 type transport system permease protein